MIALDDDRPPRRFPDRVDSVGMTDQQDPALAGTTAPGDKIVAPLGIADPLDLEPELGQAALEMILDLVDAGLVI